MKLTGTLAELAAHTKRPTVLLGDIARYLLDEHGKPSERRADVIHPSEMARDDWCPRRDYYRIMDARAGITPKNSNRFSLVTENIFATGHALHRKWQSWLEDMGVLAGRWKCLACNTMDNHGIALGHPDECASCGQMHGPWEYAEVPLSAPSHMIAGHADGYVPSAYCLVEIKTIGLGTLRYDAPDLLREYTATTPDGREIPDIDLIWRNLSAPLEPHVRQANIYLWMARNAGLDVDRMVFLYDFKPNQQVLEFTTRLDEDILDPLLDKAKTVADAVNGLAGEPARAHDRTSKTCAECPYLTTCWTIDEARDATTPQAPDGPRTVAAETLARRLTRAGRSNEGGAGRAEQTGLATAEQAGGGDGRDSGPRRRPARRRPDGPVRPDGGVAEVRRRPARTRRDPGEIGRSGAR